MIHDLQYAFSLGKSLPLRLSSQERNRRRGRLTGIPQNSLKAVDQAVEFVDNKAEEQL